MLERELHNEIQDLVSQLNVVRTENAKKLGEASVKINEERNKNLVILD
jgi:hypothetical protein